ncbi:hypothetical protein HPULCUR_004950 [Helicostylum pulchrum]|uniref:Uncharacterized protein n=1 Tax=Helicostylum pulchrum TaxID=562976 RepID=A0ABP9XXQ4_9FUNG
MAVTMNPSSVLDVMPSDASNVIASVSDSMTNLGLSNNSSNNVVHATDVSPIAIEDTEMVDHISVKESFNNDHTMNSDTNVEENKTALEKLNDQYEKIMVIIANLNQQKIKLFTEGVLDRNDVRLVTIDSQIKLVNEHCEFIKGQIDAMVANMNYKLPNNDLAYVVSNKPQVSLKDVPIFNVDPSASVWDIGTNNKDAKELSLTIFLLKFERLFVANSLDINKSWHYYLEIAFEGSSKYHTWFSLNLKNSSSVSWPNAKKVLQQRFDLASQTSVHTLAKRLISFSLEENESFILCLERFRMVILTAQINHTDNVMLFYLFLNCFPSKVQGKINQLLSVNFRNLNPNDLDNVKIHHAPADWALFERFISGYAAVIDEVLASSRSQKTIHKKRKASNEDEKTSPVDQEKASSFVASGPSSSAASRHADYHTLRAQGLCFYCKLANYKEDANHIYTCEAKKIAYSKKGYKMPVQPVSSYTENSKKNNYNIGNYNNNNIDHSVNLNYLSNDRTIPNHSVSTGCHDEKLSIDYDSDAESSDNEYNSFFNKYVQTYTNSSINNNINNVGNKSVFAVRNNNVGDNDNPCNINCSPLSPATPIILNNILSYGIIDTGASVSLISKKYAQKYNIKFHSVPGSLILADGSNIPRLQTVDPVLVEYDNIKKVIEHKFDIISNDNIINSDDEKILIGVDLLPKLKIYLSNVAVKHKSLQKEVIDSSKNDDAYVPNVTNFGTEQEQYAFENAIKTYIDKNKKLDKTTLCTIKDAVLYLPTPPGFIANIRQYPIPYSLKEQVMEIIESWEKDKIIVPAKPSGWNLPMTVTFEKDHVDGAICKDKKNIRLLLDPRKLNEALDDSSKNSHSLPLINDTVTRKTVH